MKEQLRPLLIGVAISSVLLAASYDTSQGWLPLKSALLMKISLLMVSSYGLVRCFVEISSEVRSKLWAGNIIAFSALLLGEHVDTPYSVFGGLFASWMMAPNGLMNLWIRWKDMHNKDKRIFSTGCLISFSLLIYGVYLQIEKRNALGAWVISLSSWVVLSKSVLSYLTETASELKLNQLFVVVLSGTSMTLGHLILPGNEVAKIWGTYIGLWSVSGYSIGKYATTIDPEMKSLMRYVISIMIAIFALSAFQYNEGSISFSLWLRFLASWVNSPYSVFAVAIKVFTNALI